MTIKFPLEIEQKMISSIKQFVEENMEEKIGDLKARLLLDFFLQELGPSVYNRAIADAQAQMLGRVGDLDGDCFEPEFGYWKR